MEGIEYKTIEKVTNVLLFVKAVKNAGYNEQVEIELDNGKKVSGQVLATNEEVTIVQVFGETTGMNTKDTKVLFKGTTFKMPVSMDMIGRVFDGLGRPRDGGIPVFSEDKRDINGNPINPYAREEPSEFVQTGISSIDCMNTLVRGQKLPIFSGSGLSHNKLAAQIVKQAKILAEKEGFYVVFGGIGINSEDANFFINEFQNSGALEKSVIFLNLAADPSMERVILPRLVLTTAEYLAYEKGAHVMVVLTDMTNYAEALREISAARDEVPGRRGYPGYMYTDLSSIFERAGKVKGKKGSVTQLPILTMPSDDITHPIPDLTGYITEGQIVMSRSLDKSGIYPEVDVLLSLSRLMNQGVGKGSTREDHKNVSDQMYAAYARGKEIRSLTEIVGEDALSAVDKQYLHFASEFENRFIKQDFNEDRSIEETLNLGWELLSLIDVSEMKRIKPEFIEKYGKWKQ
ncbi:MAG: H+transporting two-sector ATPase alpha/beta subunit central region [Candidatus Parvarchaeum acidophilus ARMAN-5]|jgi:V/A-type H+-transporting ATPase subunit B|uniref:A-type ATP synthase subunit B n=1 Tax=Candidatus Parvarchaeum acidophilus ARMAN-5 TaxID=662762 RepID=D6GVY4_PARA5|nr:MAG: H+transporting two-sector ATPase alpha/beta subunit central region [Candidatus Parvarchaeum acidophilus ARMAN-5]EFD92603.1 MAG: H+transporting two-sector ATPase alpha/beta subunit central region [Candidatus Parvarchaeum acidophilus ARMAN-5]